MSDGLTVLDHTWTNKLWIPDTFFPNARITTILKVMDPVVYFSVDTSSKVTQVVRMTIKFECIMDLRNYPQDTQFCPIEISSRKLCLSVCLSRTSNKANFFSDETH